MAVYTHTTESESIFQIQTPSFAIESGSFSYNQDSSLYLVVLDCGDILDGIGEELDSGDVSEHISYFEDYGSILTDTEPAFGELDTLDAKTITSFSLGHISSGGVLFALQGGSVSSFGNAYIGYEGNIFDIEGEATPILLTYGHEGSGNLSTIIGAAERVTSSFDVSSTAPFSLFKVLGDTSKTVVFSLTAKPEGGSLFSFGGGSEAIAPFILPGSGRFGISGFSIQSFSLGTIIGSGSLFSISSKEERRTFSYNSSSVVIQEDADFGFIATTSVVDEEEVIELVPHDDQDDFGIISELVNTPGSEDFGFITSTQGRPFGTLNFVGDASKTIIFNLTAKPEGGSLFSFGGGNEAVTPFIPEREGILTIAGAVTQSFTPAPEVGSGSLFNFVTKEERRTFSYNGSSIVTQEDIDFGYISTESAEISSYANTPISDFADVAISDLISGDISSDDFGIISELVNTPGSEDFGFITSTQGRPYGSLRFTGDASRSVNFRLRTSGGGSLFTFGGSAEAFAPFIPPRFVLFDISGTAEESTTPAPEVGSGSLFNFVTKEERRTFSYNGSSIVSQDDIDFGFIATTSVVDEEEVIELVPHDDQDDFGIISEVVNAPGSDDYGFISTIQGRPYGSLRFTGDASRSVKFRIRASGGGSLFSLGGGNESITPFIPASFTLFTVVGTATERITPAPEVGSGSLFNFVTKEERRTYSYNGSATILLDVLDYRFISEESPEISEYADVPISDLANDVVSTFTSGTSIISDDYGSIGEVVNAPGSDDYGFISFSDKRPYGRFRFTGLGEQAYIPRYVGSGSLFAFGGSGEVVSQTDDTKVLFTIGGSATLANTPAPHVGSGVLFTFVSADESKTFRHISDDSTGLRISGEVSDLKLTNDEVGSGRLFAATGSAETFGANPFIPPALFKFKSGSAESFTPATEIGTGIVSPRRASAIFDPEEKIRLVGATESTTNTPDIPASGFSIKAPPARIYFQYGEKGSGKLTLAGNARIRLNPRHTGKGEFNINGIGNEATVPFIPPGSGSLFSFVNGDESTTPATHIGQGNLFRPRGAAETQFPRGFAGGGQIRVNVETGIIVIWDYPVNLTIPVRGDTDYAVARDYIGTGKFTISDESDNYFANRFFSFSGGFSILGKAGVRVPKVYSGSGTLFAFDSSAENTGANPPDRTLPIRLVGTANESNTEVFTGSGFITSKEKRAERVLRYTGLTSPQISEYANTPISDLSDEVISEFLQEGLLEEYTLASANESFVSAPPTKDSAITIEGSRENENSSSDYVGSGSLFTFDSSAESTLYSPIGEITLFEFEGNLEESRAFSYSEKTQGLFGKDTNLPKPFGKQFVFGTASVVSVSSETGKDKAFKFDGGITSETFAPANKAEGGLFGFNSSTESVLYSPIGEITLFEFEGNSDESITAVSTGSGSLFGFVSGAESALVEPPVETLLLNITGSATERIIPAPHFGSGTVFAFVGSAESTTSAEEKKVLFRFNIKSVERSVSAFEGTGTITSFVGSANAFTFDYPLTQKILKIFGTKLESFARANYNGESTTEFVGASSDKVVEYEAPKPIRLYII